jgi:glycosyltransferase involved in cell wall biosynthesis
MMMPMFIAVSTLLTALLVLLGVRLGIGLKRFKAKNSYPVKHEMPSISICIPARNETHAMTQCLERALTSDYPKLEVIVYDDRSKDDTSILIKSFAHAGVRFVPGPKLPNGWLGRNHALDVLACEASGRYVVFLDVDTFIQPKTISRLVDYIEAEKLAMLSVIPGRNDAWRTSVLFGSLRYFWEVILSRPSSPAVASSLWMIDRHVLLDEMGGFSRFRNDVRPESSIASLLGLKKYHCLISSGALGVSYEKRWQSQVETSIRLLYPMVGGTWRRGLVAGFVLILLNVPLFTVLSGLIFGWTIIHVKALWLLVLFMALYSVFTSRTWRSKWWLGGLLWPVVILQELVLFVRSVWGYHQGTITWKGRPVTSSPYRDDTVMIDQ